MRIKKIDSDTVKLCETTKVKLKTAGNTRVVQFTAGNNKSCPVQNLSKETYLDKKTGEIKQKKKSENRYQSPKSARKSINRLGDLIRCNATDAKDECNRENEAIHYINQVFQEKHIQVIDGSLLEGFIG